MTSYSEWDDGYKAGKEESDAVIAELVKRTNLFVEDVMPQIGGLCIQDFANLNELCMLLSKHKGE